MDSPIKTRVWQLDADAPNPRIIAEAARLIRDGRLVAFPTETVYGLGANALSAPAIERIYAAKQRPSHDPIIAHIAAIDDLPRLAVDIPDIAFDLARALWPGALTMILKRGADVPDNIAAGLDTVAVRMPSGRIASALIASAGVPIAAPSANTFTRPSATTAAHVLHDLGGRIDAVLDGGATRIGIESTVLDLTGETPAILRPGGVLLDDIRRIAPATITRSRWQTDDAPSPSPGQMLKHYAPNARMMVYRGEVAAVLDAMRRTAGELSADGLRVGLLVAAEDRPQVAGAGVVHVLGRRDDLAAISRHLFAALRQLDAENVDVILTRDFGAAGLGAALWDRLVRAAEGRVITV